MICSTPGDQGLTLIQPQSYGSHTLRGLPQPEGRGAGAPRGGDWSPTSTRLPPPLLQLQASGSPHSMAKCQFMASAPQMLPGGDCHHPLQGTRAHVCSAIRCPARCLLFVPIKVWASPALLDGSARKGAGPEPLQTMSVGKALRPVGPQSAHISAFVRLGCKEAVAVSPRAPGTAESSPNSRRLCRDVLTSRRSFPSPPGAEWLSHRRRLHSL